MATVGYPRPLDQFDMKEIYRLIRDERIPGFNMLGSERRYLAEYREALKRVVETEDEKAQVETVAVEEEAPKKRKNSRKKSTQESEAELSEISEEVVTPMMSESVVESMPSELIEEAEE